MHTPTADGLSQFAPSSNPEQDEPGGGKPILDCGAADPAILADEDGWWLHPSQEAPGGARIPIYYSKDLQE
ncbi:MAG: hypothetical protein ACFCU3_04310 [Verrucomicrobiales bacterium]